SDTNFACGDTLAYQWTAVENGSILMIGSAAASPAATSLTLSWADLQAAGLTSPGGHTIKLTASDTASAIGAAQATLTIVSNHPAVARSADFESTRPQITLNFAAQASHTNAQNRITSYTFNWGDGSTPYSEDE